MTYAFTSPFPNQEIFQILKIPEVVIQNFRSGNTTKKKKNTVTLRHHPAPITMLNSFSNILPGTTPVNSIAGLFPLEG